jgi:thermitase
MTPTITTGRSNGSRPGLALAAATATLVVAVLSLPLSAQPRRAPEFVAGEILVKFRPGAGPASRADAHRAAGATLLSDIPRTSVQRVRVRPGAEAAAIARYQRNPNVLYAEPNFVRRVPTVAAHPAAGPVPGDYYFDQQWALNNTGQAFYCIPWIVGELCLYSGTADADIDGPEAWAITTGGSAVSVAVIDTGIDYTHPDLAVNYAGGDDFVSSDGDPMDDHGHGTHVAGTIAAALDNITGTPPGAAEGVTGIAPHARVRAYKVCRPDGTCDDFAVQQAIARAVADGANIINMSLGGPDYSQSLNDAVQDAWNAGLVIVAGAGNDGTTDFFYPAALDNVISVAAFDEDGRRASFSNHGSWVDISAPGNAIVSTYPMASCDPSTIAGDTGCYAWLSGTSMSTPHVAGAAALVWSRSDITSNRQVVDILLGSVDGRGVANVRLDAWTIHGGLNLHDAVSYGLTNLPPVADAGPDQTLTDSDGDGTELVTLDGSASADRDGSITTYAWRNGSTPIADGPTAEVWLPVGVHTLTLEVTDDGGERATDTVIVTIDPANVVTVTAPAPQATEAGPTSGTFLISRTGSTGAPLTVHFALVGSASAGTDYVSIPATVTIAAGASSIAITVTPIDDVAFESNESVVLTLTADAAYGIGVPSEAVITIVSNDLPPDLTVTSVTAPATAGAGSDVVVSDTTANQGTGPALASTTGFYLSLNTILDASDVLLASRTVPPLAAGATSVLATTVHLPPSTAPGTYFVLAKADHDGAVTESSETNNLRPSGMIRVGPDVIVSALAAPTAAAAGVAFTVSDTTQNLGGGSADESITRFYLSANTLLDASDQVVGSRTVPSLPGGASSGAGTLVTLPAGTAAGTYYLIAQADAGNAVRETVESNNSRLSSPVRVGADLVVAAVSAPSSAAPGAAIAVTDSTRNQGAGPSPASSTGFYLSTNLTIGPGDVFLGSRAIGELAPGATATGSMALQIPADIAPGIYYVVARADWSNGIAEAGETNNDRSTGPVKVGGDLVVAALSASSTGMAGGSIAVSDTTTNIGAVGVPESATAFYLSADFGFSPTGDLLLGSRPAGALQPSGASSATTALVIPPGTAAGVYYVIAVADWGGAVAESVENNNTRTSGSVR